MLAEVECTAQNWRTVLSNDSTYYAGSNIPNFIPVYTLGVHPIGHSLRIIWIDTISSNGIDTTFFFYKSLREQSYFTCIDSLADTWLGSKFIRNNNGDEFYFNADGDTILLKTLSSTGNSWILAKQNGIEYQALISSVGTQVIDGISDSFKTITLQAYQNGMPINDWYNNIQLVISKNHGWIKTVDIYKFPHCNVPFLLYKAGAVIDSGQHFRLDNSIKNIDLFNNGNFISKYQPGNEWISIRYFAISVWESTPPYNTIYTHDSVLSVVQISPNMVTATIQTRIVEKTVQSITGTSGHTWSFTDASFITSPSISSFTSPLLPLTDTLLPEYNWQLQYLNTDNDDHYFRRFYADTTCGNNHIIIQSRDLYGCYVQPPNGLMRDTNNCIKRTPTGLCQGYINEWDYMDGFGYSFISEFSATGDFSYSYDCTIYPYIKLGNCTIGTKINLSTLAVNEVERQNNFHVFPNPAKNFLGIEGVKTFATVEILDIIGRKVLSTNYENNQTINISSLQSGTYIVRIITNNGIWKEKLIVIK